MRTCINRQRKRTAFIIKRGPKSYEFIYHARTQLFKWGGAEI